VFCLIILAALLTWIVLGGSFERREERVGVQMVLNFFIPSGSIKAALTMPLFAPISDLAGITRQTAVLAYQFGDGFTNMIIPTSGVTVGTLTMAKIPYEKWFRWHWPMQVAFFGLSLVFLVWPVLANWE
jgi:uncharacterized ion transporter superfamily protein YfcC